MNFTYRTSGDIICNQDLAEAYTSAEPTESGDLVVLIPETIAKVRKSTKPYEELLAGVVSTNPGLVFDNGQTHLAGDLIWLQKTRRWWLWLDVCW